MNLPDDCPNYNLGCLFRGREAEVEDHHLNECQFKPSYCPDLWCQKLLPLNGLLAHIESVSPGIDRLEFEGNAIKRNVSNGYRKAKVLFGLRMAKWQEHTVFPMVYKKGNIYHIWMYLLGDKDAAIEFPDIKISLEGPRSSVSLKTRAISVQVSLKDVLDNIDALLTLTNYQAWQCVTYEGGYKNLDIKFEIVSDLDIVEGPGFRTHTTEEKLRLKEAADSCRTCLPWMAPATIRSRMEIGERRYLINSQWFANLSHYLGCESRCNKHCHFDKHPGPLTNEWLFAAIHPYKADATDHLSILRQLESELIFIPEEHWNTFVEAFGFR